MKAPFVFSSLPSARVALFLAAFAFSVALALPACPQALRIASLRGAPGGHLSASLRAEPRTLNPVFATDSASRTVTSILNADLLHINRATDAVEPALASSWQVSRDGQSYLLHLRHGVRFSDGSPFTADDVLFSFRVYLDPKLNAPQRDLLIIDGQPIRVTKLGPDLVRFDLPHPYAATARLFDGIAILPSHLLQPLLEAGALASAWTLVTPPAQLAGLGPFRLRSYRPGQSLVLERNPYYWKQDAGNRPLPYLDEVDFSFASNQDAEAIRFTAGQLDLISRLTADTYSSLQKLSSSNLIRELDGGPGLEFDLLLFNLNADLAAHLPQAAHTQTWFLQLPFRQALSLAVDRPALVHLVFQDHAVPLASPVTPASGQWANPTLRPTALDLPRARRLLADAGFRWRGASLYDRGGNPVRFTIIATSSNRAQSGIATLLARNFAALGIDVQVVPLEFRSFLQRITQSHDYDLAVMALSAGDTDPNGNMSLWLSSGNLHLWNQGEAQPATPWEAEIDSLMRQQMTLTDIRQRRAAYFRIQSIYAAQLPFLSLVSPNMLAAVRAPLAGAAPGPLDPGMLDNIASFYWRKGL